MTTDSVWITESRSNGIRMNVLWVAMISLFLIGLITTFVLVSRGILANGYSVQSSILMGLSLIGFGILLPIAYFMGEVR